MDLSVTFRIFYAYFGNIWLILLYLAAVIHLWFTEKRKEIRILLIYYPLLGSLLFLCPLTYRYLKAVTGESTYYRLLWLLPMGLTIAYGIVKLITGIRKISVRIAATLLCMALLCGTGAYVYANPYFSVAENRFHIPAAVQNLCDRIGKPGREIPAAFPPYLMNYVRQYDATIRMPYGRDSQVEAEGWKKYPEQAEFCDAMSQPVLDCARIAELAKASNTYYVIVHRYHPLEGAFEDYGYDPVANVDDYVIYYMRDAYPPAE